MPPHRVTSLPLRLPSFRISLPAFPSLASLTSQLFSPTPAMSIAPPEPAVGLRPPAYEHSIHLQRCLAQLRSKESPLEKYIYLSQLKDADPRAFYRLAVDHMSEVTPLIYTPTVGEACQKWSHIYRRPDGMYISLKDKGKIGAVLRNWPRQEEARISVVTDGSRILGLGDLGVNGMGISVGKLSLYIAGAGIRPESTIPICLDLGTNNKKNLDDPFYLGLRQPRASSEEYHDFMEEFMAEMKNTFPKLLVQFEDFTTDHAFEYLGAFRDRYPVFNDDIQGTGAVVLSGFVNAAKQASLASGRPLSDHRILFFGAGSAGVGVAMQLLSFFTISGLSEAEARERVWFVDTQGLIYDIRGKLAEHKKYFARKDYAGPPITNLLDIINYVKPTALIGLSTISGAFYKEAVELMAALNPRPIIFPLSNPVTLSECSFHDALTWTNGKVIFASGSPFPAEEYQGVTHTPGQGNNMYIFPALGLGAILSRAKHVTDSMVEASSLALADSLTEDEKKEGLLYPRLERIREIGVKIASQVIRTAQSEGVDTTESLRTMKDDELAAYVKSRMWNP
ncbi:malic enzyme [Sistotremastrum niveocremeum HHB9708]|uniref:Malic enzyme n=1 Tax=Sistotremastrum niveocremeum HHB9708 TaxID=1314777 RepID=A0A164XWQ9_9AGAM|nr:malic enzyme [Sistotremastrum niveocremeum HHB9708]